MWDMWGMGRLGDMWDMHDMWSVCRTREDGWYIWINSSVASWSKMIGECSVSVPELFLGVRPK